ncbi:MAG TPA: HEAT repeat domain-containing protein [Thermoanaerobaculia bacterium]
MIIEGLLLLLGAGAGAGILESRRRLRGWRDAAVSCGLEVTQVSRGWSSWVKARDGQGEVLIELSGDGASGVRIVVEAPGPEDFHLVQIRPQPPGPVGELDILDIAFDSEFYILGPVLLVSALLNEETRNLLSLVNTEGRLAISSGTLRVNLTDSKVPRVLPRLLDLRTRFAMPLHIPRRLAENVMRDPVPGVRVHNLLLLMNEFPDAPETAEALHAIRWDPSPEARLRIGIELGAQTRGRDLLEKILADLEDDGVSARAVSFLSGDLPFERMRDILERALSRHCRRTASTCLEVIGSSGNAAAVEVLAKVLDQEHGNLAPVVARALGATGSPAAEPPLLHALERDHSELQVAAAEALSRVGSAAAVLPLKELIDRFPQVEVRKAAREAVAEIQSRVQGASPGQLSLAGAEAGQLSLAEAEAGQLSLADDPAGQLSLPSGEGPA